MLAAQPISLDALRRLIAENDYWNPHSSQHKELQRKVQLNEEFKQLRSILESLDALPGVKVEPRD